MQLSFIGGLYLMKKSTEIYAVQSFWETGLNINPFMHVVKWPDIL